MKVSIITLHSIHNFGSSFQAYALYKYIEQMGCEAEIIDYRPLYTKTGRNPIRTLCGKILNFAAYYNRNQKFNKFIKNKMKLSQKCYTTFNQLKEKPPLSDVYIAGGDQLWNDYHNCGNDPAFKLSFIDKVKKVSYGTSMGRSNYTNDEISKLASSLTDFFSIGVREKSSETLLRENGVKNVFHVADPVLLLDIKEYLKIAKKPEIDNYLLVYLVDSSDLLENAANMLSEKLKLKVVHVCGFRKKCSCDFMLKDSGPEEMLGLIANASFVLSGSLHATLFSLMFNKEFATILPGINTNARIEELLEHVGLSERIIRNDNDIQRVLKPVEFSDSNEILKNFVKESKEYLSKFLFNVE